MSRFVAKAIFIAFWLAILSCRSAPHLDSSSNNICKGESQIEHPPEDAELVLEYRHMSQSVVENVYFHADATVCVTRQNPKFASLFSVSFERGSAVLDPSEMPPSACEGNEKSLTETQKAACLRWDGLEFEIDRARAQSPFQPPVLIVNGYAWPWETECEAEAVELSRRRAEAVADWLRSQEQFDISLKIAANGTQAPRPPGLIRRVIGVDLGPQPLTSTSIGPPLDKGKRSRIAKIASQHVAWEEGPPTRYRMTESLLQWRGDDALIDWVHGLVEQGCNPAGGLLDLETERYE